jgi:hypothetical protein
MELVYRNRSSARISRTLTGGVTRSNGYVYEVEFWQENVQALYEMELWGRLQESSARGAPPGHYQEHLQFEIIGVDR